MKSSFRVLVVLAAALLSGCATQVDKDYSQYLENNEGRVDYPDVGKPALYYLDKETADNKVEIKSWMAGIANSWTVQFGEILVATMEGGEMQASFESLSRTYRSTDPQPLLVLFHLNYYGFADFHATIDLTIDTLSNGETLSSERYRAEGISQGGKMFWGGAMTMNNAVQQSTMYALDEILMNYLEDLNETLKSQNAKLVATSRSLPLGSETALVD